MTLRILVVTHIDIYGMEPNGSIHAIRTLLNWLSKQGEVDVYCTRPLVREAGNNQVKVHAAPLEPMGRFRVLLRTRLDNFLVRNLRAIFNELFERLILSYKRRKSGGFYDQKKINALRDYLSTKQDYDVVIIEYIHNAYLADAFTSKATKFIIDTHDIMYQRAESFIAAGVAPALEISKVEEYRILNSFDYVMAIQKSEAEHLRRDLGDKVLSVPRPQTVRSEECCQAVTEDRPLRCLFFASNAIFNVHAMGWFVEQVWQADLGKDVELLLAGTICDVLPKRLSRYFTLLGKVDDPAEAYRHCDLVINPIRIGSGLKIKNLEAMAFCKPVVTTRLGAEGMEEAEGNGMWVIDDAEGIKSVLRHLSRECAEIDQMARLGRDYVQRTFNEEACFQELQAVLADLASQRDSA